MLCLLGLGDNSALPLLDNRGAIVALTTLIVIFHHHHMANDAQRLELADTFTGLVGTVEHQVAASALISGLIVIQFDCAAD